MGTSWFLRFLLVALLLVLSSSQGFHRKLMDKDADFTTIQESAGKSREAVELMDYEATGPNTNPKAGYIFTPPPRV